LRALMQQAHDAYDRRDARRGLKLSLEFHRELARVAANGVLAEFLDQLIARTPLVVLTHKAGGVGNSCSNDEHAEILEAVARGDVTGAAAAMTSHLANLEAQLDLTEAPPQVPDFAALFAVTE